MPLLDREFVRTLEQLSLVCREDLSGTIGIDHRSRNRGPGLEFADYRRYSSGDDPRFLDWNAYLRLGKLFLKIYQTEEHIPVRILLDTSESMEFADDREPGEPKFLYAQRLAAAFTFLALLRLDTAVVVPFGTKIGKPMLASGGRDRVWPVLQYMSELRTGGPTDLLNSVKQFLGSFPGRGVAIVISDFFEDGACDRAVEMLRFSGHDFVLLQVHTPDEQRPSEVGELRLEEAETGAVQTVFASKESAEAHERAFLEFSSRLERLAIRNGGRYARAVTSVPCQTFILDALRGTRVVE